MVFSDSRMKFSILIFSVFCESVLGIFNGVDAPAGVAPYIVQFFDKFDEFAGAGAIISNTAVRRISRFRQNVEHSLGRS